MTAHWKVSFTRRGMEPPRPFGKTYEIVCAETRDAAKRQVNASPHYRITASKVKGLSRVSFGRLCRCHEGSR